MFGILCFQLSLLRREIERVAAKEPYMGEQMPIKWLKFEQEVAKLVEQGTNHASYDQVRTHTHTM